jgi:methionine sulfoxide reductase heme-binding subunit
MRLSGAAIAAVAAAAILLALAVTNVVLPPGPDRLDAVRPWLVARATGVTAYLLLAFQVGAGLVMSHPTNVSTWKLSKRVFPWHEHLAVFTLAFLAIHSVLLAIDRYANVGVWGAIVPGLSSYRPPAIAVGTIATYSLLVMAVTARWTKLLPRGAWLKIHRLSAVAFALAWAHSFLAGTDGGALQPLYLATGLPIVALVAHRWWVVRVRPARQPSRPTAPAGSPVTVGSRTVAGGPATRGSAAMVPAPVAVRTSQRPEVAR